MYDALLLVSFGGPEGPDDVIPFLENVTRGRNIPPERLAEVGGRYAHFGGISPINDQNRALLAALRIDFTANDLDLPIYWGNRNWAPYLADALAEMAADGVRRALAFVTSAYASYSGCRQYREDLAAAAVEVGPDAPQLDKIRHYFNHPGFIEPMVRRTITALGELPAAVRAGAHLVFTTHSIPLAQMETSGPDGGAYVVQHRDTAGLVADAVAVATGTTHPWQLIYQSRSGPPTQPWLGPDVADQLEELHRGGAPAAVLVPIGFVSDHVEVLWDLDVEALNRAAELGLPAVRAGTVGTDPQFVAMVRELVLERVGRAAQRSLGALGASHDVCPADCCPNPRGPRPAVAQASAR